MIEAKGLNSARAEFSGDEAQINAEDCKSRYSLEYLIKFIKGCKLSEKTILNFAANHPLKMELRDNGMELSFILAPRVETED
jgi:DNA polymerase III sliding clamp (beta) subunit (PCNA family)